MNGFDKNGLEIAVIGMSLRFPGAKNKNEFWECLTQGKETITRFTDDELRQMGVREDMLSNPNYVKANGIIDLEESFDSALFHYTAEEAAVMHPLSRKMHECAYEALEDAGYNPYRFEGEIGFYAGTGSSTLWELNVELNKNNVLGRFSSSFLSDAGYAATNIAYKLDFKGPSVQVKSACSSSLVAIHMACRALLAGECDIALVGGATIGFGNRQGYLYIDGSVYSKDGHCKPFDADATGTVPGDGVGIVVLKPLEAAVEDGDHIYAVIKGSAVNGDGSQKAGYTAPGLMGEARVIRDCLKIAEVDPSTIDYIEAHGTGTRLGDDVEIDALKLIYGELEPASCAIGSVKGNLGHLDSASGVAGFIKTVLCLYHKEYVSSLFYNESSSSARFSNTPFYVNTVHREWRRRGYLRRAAVSSYGIGGTNAHVILEEHPTHEADVDLNNDELLLLSANSPKALQTLLGRLAEDCLSSSGFTLRDIAFTLQTGRVFRPERACVTASSKSEAAEYIINREKGGLFTGKAVNSDCGFVFMFPGQGIQYRNIGYGLYRANGRFREEMDRCFELFSTQGYDDIKRLLYPGTEVYDLIKDRYDVTSAINFAIGYSLAKTLIPLGITPSYLIGHSVGEYACACVAGIFSLPDAIRMVLCRGKLMNSLPSGRMISVPVQYEELIGIIGERPISIAADHGYACLVAGTNEDMTEFANLLQQRRIIVQELDIHIAGHTETVNRISAEYTALLHTVRFMQGSIPIVSSCTGNVVTNDMSRVEYWVVQMTAPVMFAQSIKTILADGKPYLFVEVGAGNVLSRVVQYIHGIDKEIISFPMMRHHGEQVTDYKYLLRKIGAMWLQGGAIDWVKYNGSKGKRRVPVCTYPFENTHYPYRFDALESKWAESQHNAARKDIKDWYYIPVWKRKLISQEENDINIQYVVAFISGSSFDKTLLSLIKECECRTVCVYSGLEYRHDENDIYWIDPENEEHFAELINSLHEKGKFPDKYLFTWGLSQLADVPSVIGKREIDDAGRLGIYSIMNLTKTLGGFGKSAECEIIFLTNDVQKVQGFKVVNPQMAPALGAVITIPAEYPDIRCRAIDISLEVLDDLHYANSIVKELFIRTQSKFIVYRDGIRMESGFEPIEIRNTKASMRMAGDKKVFLFIGGFGGIGYELMKHVSGCTRDSVFIVLQRSAVTGYQKRFSEVEISGNRVRAYQADISDESAVRIVINSIYAEYGAINGVFFCAGSYEGSLIHNLTPDIFARVFAAKIYGSVVIHRYIRKECLDFYFFCSSFNVYKGSAGTVGYTAANMFVDAYANYLYDCFGVETKCINWFAWKETGGAVRHMKKMISQSLDSFQSDKFTKTFNCVSDWVLSEHCINGYSVLPGTAYINLIAAYIESRFGVKAFRLFDMYCPNPLSTASECSIEAVISEAAGKYYEFEFTSGADGSKCVHFQGCFDFEVMLGEPFDYSEIMLNIDKDGCWEDASGFNKKRDNLSLGKRWTSSVKRTAIGNDCGAVCLELNDEFIDDLNNYYLHPALLDLSLCTLTQDDSLFLPFYYKCMYVYGRFPQRVTSVAKLCNRGEEAVSYSYVVLDEVGQPLITVEEYTLVRAAAQIVMPGHQSKHILRSAQFELNNAAEAALEDGLTTREGIEIFHNVMNSELRHVAICPVDIHNELTKKARNVPSFETTPTVAVRKRNCNILYVEPKDEIQMKLVDIWKRILGIDQVGINDNYFELGATSLSIIQFNQIAQKELDRDIPVVSYYMNPTISSFSGYLFGGGNTGNAEIKIDELVSLNRSRLSRRRGTTQENNKTIK